jgi:inhibitor of KinA sporulation pathway (predicted exonuclease)
MDARPDAVAWVDVDGYQGYESGGSSPVNQKEARLVARLVAAIEKRGGGWRTSTCVVLTPFSAQRALIEKLCPHSRLNKGRWDVKTVDSFQGREADIVIISLVRTDGRVGFLKDVRRANVMLSRAKSRMLLVGDRGSWAHCKNLLWENLATQFPSFPASGDFAAILAAAPTPMAQRRDVPQAAAADGGDGDIRFLAVLDFEATCWSDDREKQRRETEIIEFPTVLYRVTGGALQRLAEWRRFVRPTSNPQLSAFCTQMTSITQAQVDAAETLAPTLAEHAAWLASATGGAPACQVLFVTCGDWDLGTCLPLEERNKGLCVPAVYKRWANLKTEFREAFRVTVRVDLAEMLAMAGLQLEGHHHSGLDDSRNIGRVLEKVWQLGHHIAAFQRREYPRGVR